MDTTVTPNNSTSDSTPPTASLRLGASCCAPHRCPCGSAVDRLGHHDLSCSRSADVLQAVKQDPAVLEAQITIDSNKLNALSPEPEKLALAQNNPSEEIEIEEPSASTRFEEMVNMQKAALLSLAPEQLDLLLKYAAILRMQRLLSQKYLECAFCKNNGEPTSWYSNHMLKDHRGRVRCPVLRGYRCPACGATGDHAHTIKYCPENYDQDRWSR